MILIKIICYFY
jgi:hypothetical protein